MMENLVILASFWSNLFLGLKIAVAALAFVAATALIVACGGPALLALGVGTVAGGAAYFVVGLFEPKPPLPPPPPKPVITTTYEIAFGFSPGPDGSEPFTCRVRDTKIVTTTIGETSTIEKTPQSTQIQATNGQEFEIQFKNRLENLKKNTTDGEIKSITIYEEPFPGETPLEMMWNACDETFPKVLLKTEQEALP